MMTGVTLTFRHNYRAHARVMCSEVFALADKIVAVNASCGGRVGTPLARGKRRAPSDIRPTGEQNQGVSTVLDRLFNCWFDALAFPGFPHRQRSTLHFHVPSRRYGR